MKKSIIKSTAMTLLLIGVTACGSNSSSIEEVKVKAFETGGEFGESIEISSKEISVTGGYVTKCTVEIAIIEKEEMDGYEPYLELLLLSDDNNVISEMSMDYRQKEQLTRLLSQGTGKLKVHFDGYEMLSEKITRFSIETGWKEVKSKTTTSDNSNEETSSTSNNSASASNVDDMLDSYDDYIDTYVSLAKKMQKDPSNSEVIEEYTEYMQKATDLATKLDKCKNEMSNAQVKRMMKIQSRMAEAIK